jgi:hypothetical protein
MAEIAELVILAKGLFDVAVELKPVVDKTLHKIKGQEYKDRRRATEQVYRDMGGTMPAGDISTWLGWFIPGDFRSEKEIRDRLDQAVNEKKVEDARMCVALLAAKKSY